MGRLIDADELLTAFPIDDEPTLTKSCVRMTIQHMPTIEPQRWIPVGKENDMKLGEAWVILHDIDSDKYTVEEKGLAIKMILDMETHNSVTKAMFVKALRWLWNEHFEWKGENDGQTD